LEEFGYLAGLISLRRRFKSGTRHDGRLRARAERTAKRGKSNLA
jgi:hypothetical protein